MGPELTGVGRMLAEAREAKGLSLEQAERDTRIVRRYLIALEDERFEEFPAEVYARGFLRSYGSYLGLNPADLVALLPRAKPPEATAPPRRRRRSRPEPAPDPLTSPERLPRAPQPSSEASPAAAPHPRPGLPGSPLLKLGAAVAGGIILAALIGKLAGSGSATLPGGAGGIRVPGAVATREPAPGVPVAGGQMPDLRGQDAGSALAQLGQMGVTPFVIEIPSRDAPAGQVIRQSPAPGDDVHNVTVTIVISQGG
jgi:hypothetical protein